MNMTRFPIRYLGKLLFLAIIGALCASALHAESANMDLLLGLGDFSKCTFSRIYGIDDLGIPPTANLHVADGWTATTVERDVQNGDLSLSDLSRHTYQIVDTTNFTADGRAYMDAGKSYQYIAVKYAAGQQGYARLSATIRSLPRYPEDTLQPGDKVILHIDKIISSNFDSLNPPSVHIGILNSSSYVEIPIKLASGVATGYSCTLTVTNPTYVSPFITMRLQQKTATTDAQGILVTGVRLWLQRKDRDVVVPDEAVPYQANRTISTIKSAFCDGIPARYVARNYSITTGNPWDYFYIPILRRLNRNEEFYIYQSTNIIESSRPARWMLGPLKIEDVAANHPDWLYPQTVPPISYDPATNPDLPNSPYVGRYLNMNGMCDQYPARLSNKQYQDEWVKGVISIAKAVGADGILIDAGSCLDLTRDGAQRDTWETQQFLHYIVPKLRSAGLSCIFMDVVANLDGSRGYCGDYTEVFYNPSWKPTVTLTEAMGYSANTPENTPDVFLREYSFLYNDYSYKSDYWLKCIEDAGIVSAWNSKLSEQQPKKRIFYDVEQEDTQDHPAINKNGKAGWATFTVASFLLCNNEFISFGIGYGQEHGYYYDDPKLDYSITQKLGIPDGSDSSIDGKIYFRMRRYKADGKGAVGGVVVVNGDTKLTNTFSLSSNAVDETGQLHLAGTKVDLLPNMGRIFINVVPASGPNISIGVAASITSVKPGQAVTINVNYSNTGSTDATDVLVRATVPSQVSYVMGSAELSGGAYDGPTNTVSWVISKIAAKKSGTKTFQALIK